LACTLWSPGATAFDCSEKLASVTAPTCIEDINSPVVEPSDDLIVSVKSPLSFGNQLSKFRLIEGSDTDKAGTLIAAL